MPLFSRFHVKPLKIKAFRHSRPYSHSPVELFHMNDICDTQKTVEEFLKNEVDLGLLHK